MVSKFTFTPPLKTDRLFPISYSKFHYPCVQTHLFESNFHSLLSTLSPQKLSHLPLNFCSSEALSSLRHEFISPIWVKLSLSPFNSFSPKAFSSETLSSWRHGDVWRCGCGFDIWKSWFLLAGEWFHGETFWYLNIWVLFGFGNGFTNGRFDVWSWGLNVFGNKTCWV